MEIQISDNGKGFDLDELKKRAFNNPFSGLKNIRNRTALLEGEVKIESRLGTGTNIIIIIPNHKTYAETNG